MRMMLHRIKTLSIILSAVLLLTFLSCNENIVYYQYISTPLSGWDKNDTLSFFFGDKHMNYQKRGKKL